MAADATLRRLQLILHVFAMATFAGTIAELIAARHYGETLRLVPFALTGLGLVALAIVWLRPSVAMIAGTAALMVVIGLGSLLGMYEHIQGNLELVHEVRRNPTNRQLIDAALTGRNPLLAPGALAVGALLGLTALYTRRALQNLSVVAPTDNRSSTRTLHTLPPLPED